MRGLEIRIALANARVVNAINAAAGEVGAPQMIADCAINAMDQGFIDASAGETNPPAMFANEPMLLDDWHHGQNLYFSATAD